MSAWGRAPAAVALSTQRMMRRATRGFTLLVRPGVSLPSSRAVAGTTCTILTFRRVRTVAAMLTSSSLWRQHSPTPSVQPAACHSQSAFRLHGLAEAAAAACMIRIHHPPSQHRHRSCSSTSHDCLRAVLPRRSKQQQCSQHRRQRRQRRQPSHRGMFQLPLRVYLECINEPCTAGAATGLSSHKMHYPSCLPHHCPCDSELLRMYGETEKIPCS